MFRGDYMMNQKSVSENIENYFDEMFNDLEDCNEEPWDEETQKNWEEKMNS